MTMKNLKLKIRELRKLPTLKWGKEGIYDSLLIIPSGRKHESGWALIYIIGQIKGKPIEIAAYCDDIHWVIPRGGGACQSPLRNDMYYPSGVIRFWSREYRFKIVCPVSSTDVELIPNAD